MAKQRNNISRLDFEQRMTVCEMLADGLPYGEIRTRLAAFVTEKPCTLLHNSSFLAYQKSDEYKQFLAAKLDMDKRLRPKRVTASLINGGRGIESAADMAALELLEQIQGLSGSGLEVKDIQRLAQAAVALKRSSVSAKEKALQSELDTKEAAYKAQIEELTSKIALLEEKLGDIPVDNSAVIAAMDRRVKGE